MRFIVASPDHARRKSRLLKDLLGRVGTEATLTDCQATVARCLGYASWSEMLGCVGGPPSALDEQSDLSAVIARIEAQVSAIASCHGLAPGRAAGVAKALALTSRQRTEDVGAELAAFDPLPSRLVPMRSPDAVRRATSVLFLLQWEESERGWGTRPDGYSVHESAAHARDYVESHWARQPKEIPDEYERPSSQLARIVVPYDHLAAKALREGRFRLRGEEARACDAVWTGEAGGWVSMASGGKGRRG